jgi:CRISPR-associated protein Csm4
MSIWKLVKLNFGNCPAHFGELGIGLEQTSERVRSDTLFSAWVIAYIQLFGESEATQLFERLNSAHNLPFRLSSTFIYHQRNGEDIYYLPRPAKFPAHYPLGQDLEFSKDYKKLSFLPLRIWRKWYQEEEFEQKDIRDLGGKYGETFKLETLPKISVDRTTSSANLYHTGFVRYRSDNNPSGLYFLICFLDEDLELQKKLEDRLKASLYWLGDEGIGGERSSGAGRFEPTWHELTKEWQELIDFDHGDFHSLISLFWDENLDDGFLDSASYELLERGGWISSYFSGKQQRRKTLRMFLEGSTFTTKPVGKLANVTPTDADHAVYRSGIALSLQIKAYREIT